MQLESLARDNDPEYTVGLLRRDIIAHAYRLIRQQTVTASARKYLMRLLIPICLVAATAFSGRLQADDVPDFNREVRPLLSDRCLACHGPDATNREADLRLDDFESITADRDGYAVVVPEKPEQSELWRRINSSDPDEVMPPEHLQKSLSQQEKDILRRWILAGAKIERHWAYVPPKHHTAPEVRRPDWGRPEPDARA